MRRLGFCAITLIASASLVAQSKPVLTATTHLLDKTLYVGDSPLALIKILNTSGNTVFINQNQLQIFAEYDYPDQPKIPMGIPGGIVEGKSLATDPNRRDFKSSIIIAVEPGQSFQRIVQAPKPSKHGNAVLNVYAFFPTSYIEGIREVRWSPYSALAATVPVIILPAPAK